MHASHLNPTAADAAAEIATLLHAEQEAGPASPGCACFYGAVKWVFDSCRRHSFSLATASRAVCLLQQAGAAGAAQAGRCGGCACAELRSADATRVVAALSIAAKRDEAGLPNDLSAIQAKMPWGAAAVPAPALTAAELRLLSDLEWRTSVPTPCDFAGALVSLALPGAEAGARRARAAAGAVADAAVEAAATGRAGPAAAAARASAIGAAAALIGLHGAGRGDAAAAIRGLMDETAVSVLESLRAALRPASPAPEVVVVEPAVPAPAAPARSDSSAASAAPGAVKVASVPASDDRESTPTSVLEADWAALALRSGGRSGGRAGAAAGVAPASGRGGVAKRRRTPRVSLASGVLSPSSSSDVGAGGAGYDSSSDPGAASDGRGGGVVAARGSRSRGAASAAAAAIAAAAIAPAVPRSGAWSWAT